MESKIIKRVTLGDVAQRSETPLQIVSHILNGNAGSHPRSVIETREVPAAILTCGVQLLDLINRTVNDLKLGNMIQVVGFGCSHQMKYITPAPSLLSVDSSCMGRQAAQLMVSRIESCGRSMPAREVLIDPVFRCSDTLAFT